MNDPPAAPVDLHDVSLRSLDDDDQRRSNDAAMKSVEPAPHLEVANNEGSDTFVRRERDGQPQQSASHHRQPQVLSDSGNAFHHSTTALSARSSSFVSCDDAFQRQTSFMPPGANDTTTTALSMSHDNSNAAAADAKQTTGSHLQVIIGDVSVEETYYSPNSTALETPFSGTAPRPDSLQWSPTRGAVGSGKQEFDAGGTRRSPVNPMLSVVIASTNATIAAAAASAELSAAMQQHHHHHRGTLTPPTAIDAQSEPTSYSPRDDQAPSPGIIQNTAPPTRCTRGREEESTPMSSVSDQMTLNLFPTVQQRNEHNTRHHRQVMSVNSDGQIIRSNAPNGSIVENAADMIITTSTSQVTSHRPTHADPANDDEMDEHIQHLYAAHEPGAARFESDRELLNAVERKVSETIAKLDAGEDYEQTPLTEAIIRRHLEKQRRIEAEVAASSEQLQSHLGMSQHVLLSPEQRKLLAVAGYMDDFLPHLHNVGPKTWFPMGELRFDFDDDDDDRRNSSEGDGPGEDELTFERPASTNAPGGIKPYRPAVPPPGSASTSSHLHEDLPPPHTTVIGVAGAPSAPQNLQAICRAMLWKGYRTGKPFAKCSIIIPLVLSIIVAAIFNYAGGPVCGGLCSCDVSEHALYVFTYGLAVRVLPTSVVFAYVLHIMVYAHHRVLLEQGEAEAGNGTAGARVLMSLSSRRNSRRKSSTKGAASAQLVKLATTAAAFVKGGKEDVGVKSLPDDEKALRRDAIEALRSPTGTRPNNAVGAASPARGASVVTSDQDCSVPWDVPSLKFCAQQRTFIAFTTITTLLMSLTQFASAVGFPDLTIVPVEAAALFLPTVGFCFVLRVPKAVWPMIALEAFPFVAYFAEPSLGMPRKVFQILWPFLVVVTERLFFYAFAAVSLPSFPIGARVAATTMITFTSHVLILTNSMFVPREVGPLIGIGMQVLLYELLLGTLVLDRIWMVLKAQWQFRVRGMKPQLPQLAASDLRCIGTQTRWVSLLMAMFSVIPVRIWRVWPRAVKGGLSCHDGSIREGQFYPESLGVVVGCFLIAAVITGLIRRCNDCLRAPLMVRGVGFPITIGLYLFSTATLGLAAGAYGVIWPAGM